MNAISQHPVNELACEIEPIAEAAWPARATVRMDGWLLRFSDGYSSRANSVSTLAFDGTLPNAIERVEAAYRARGLAPQFQISPASTPAGLEAALVARGYRHRTPTSLMTADAALLATAAEQAQALAVPNADFIRLTLDGSHSAADGEERLATLTRITTPKAYFIVNVGHEGVACGASVAIGKWASVYVMRTSLRHRRHGHARRVLAGIASWAGRQGATQLYLQVDETNEPARALYAGAGFRDGYRYFHYVAPQPKA